MGRQKRLDRRQARRGQAPEVDGKTYLVSSDAREGDMVEARVVSRSDHDLLAEPI